jgi:hypothetical protein
MPIYRFTQPRLGRGRLDTWRLRAFRMVALLAALIAICAVGLALLDNSSRDLQGKLMLGLWNALNLITTLGDFSTFDASQRGFMLFIMLGVIVLGAYSMSQLTGILSSEAVLAYKENRDMEKVLDKLDDHAVLIGYQGVARALARNLRDAGTAVVVIERDESAAALASDEGFLVVHGEVGVDDDVLHKARIDSARSLFVTSDDPNRKLAITLMAHTLNSKLQIVVSGDNARWGEMFRRAGATHVLVLDQLLAEAMAKVTTQG